VLQDRYSSGTLGRVVGGVRAVGEFAERDGRDQHGVGQFGRLVEPERCDDAGVDDAGLAGCHRPVPSYGSRRSWLTASSRSPRNSLTSIAGAVTKIARTSSLGTIWRRRIGVSRASGWILSRWQNSKVAAKSGSRQDWSTYVHRP
jgi:hypothetical protein